MPLYFLDVEKSKFNSWSCLQIGRKCYWLGAILKTGANSWSPFAFAKNCHFCQPCSWSSLPSVSWRWRYLVLCCQLKVRLCWRFPCVCCPLEVLGSTASSLLSESCCSPPSTSSNTCSHCMSRRHSTSDAVIISRKFKRLFQQFQKKQLPAMTPCPTLTVRPLQCSAVHCMSKSHSLF